LDVFEGDINVLFAVYKSISSSLIGAFFYKFSYFFLLNLALFGSISSSDDFIL
jgi:hypothetical protein